MISELIISINFKFFKDRATDALMPQCANLTKIASTLNTRKENSDEWNNHMANFYLTHFQH